LLKDENSTALVSQPLFDWGTSAPAWVQAIGSIIAVAVALYVPFITNRHNEERAQRERLVAGRAVAILISPVVEDFFGQIVRRSIDFETLMRQYNGEVSVAGFLNILRIAEMPKMPDLVPFEQIQLLDPKISSPLLTVMARLPMYIEACEHLAGEAYRISLESPISSQPLHELNELAIELRRPASTVLAWLPAYRDGDAGTVSRLSAMLERKINSHL